nr:hypothetical protein JG3_0130 [uncultured bacterium]
MVGRLAVGFLVVLGLLLSFASNGQCQSKDELLKKLDQVKGEYYAKKYEIDNKVRILSRDWHEKELATYAKMKADPTQVQALKAELWAGAKELAKQKKDLFNQLTPLRKEWYQTRMDAEKKIAEIEDQASQQAKK